MIIWFNSLHHLWKSGSRTRPLMCVRLNLINHLVGFIMCQFDYNLAISNPMFRWESCKGSVWKSVKKCSRLCNEAGTRGWILRVARGLQAARRCTRVKHVEKLNRHASCSTTRQKVQTGHSVSSWLGLATHSSHEAKSPDILFWKTNCSHSKHTPV